MKSPCYRNKLRCKKTCKDHILKTFLRHFSKIFLTLGLCFENVPLDIKRLTPSSGLTSDFKLKENMSVPTHSVAAHLTFNFLQQKLTDRLLLFWSMVTPILVIMRLFIFELLVHMWQTDRQTDRRTVKTRIAAYLDGLTTYRIICVRYEISGQNRLNQTLKPCSTKWVKSSKLDSTAM